MSHADLPLTTKTAALPSSSALTGSRIRQRRSALGMRQADLAKTVKVAMCVRSGDERELVAAKQ